MLFKQPYLLPREIDQIVSSTFNSGITHSLGGSKQTAVLLKNQNLKYFRLKQKQYRVVEPDETRFEIFQVSEGSERKLLMLESNIFVAELPIENGNQYRTRQVYIFRFDSLTVLSPEFRTMRHKTI